MIQQATELDSDIVRSSVTEVVPEVPDVNEQHDGIGVEPDAKVEQDGESLVTNVIRRSKGVGDAAVKLRTVVASGLVIVMIAGLGVLGWLLHAKTNDVDRMNRSAAGSTHAEQVALDYAVNAADMNFQDLPGWQGRLTKGTSPELSNKLSQAATSMEQIITPLQWVSTAAPIAAKVRSVTNGVYSVDCFVSVLTKNSQAPDGIQSTATYRLTIDSATNWIITDVGGIGSALTSK